MPFSSDIISDAPHLVRLLLETMEAETISRDRVKGVLLGLAVGNLLGLPVEGLAEERIARHYPCGVTEIDPRERNLPMDDDLAQAVELGEALLADEDFLGDFARRLIRWRSENGRGIGHTTSAVIDLLEQGHPPPEAGHIIYEQRNRIAPNGGVMRCAPVALARHGSPLELVRDSSSTCAVTHYAPECQWSCIIINVAIVLLMGGKVLHPTKLLRAISADGAPAQVVEWVKEVDESMDSLRLRHRHFGHTLLCMQFGLWATITPLDFEEALVQVMGAGGDTDTNGAVAGAVLGARYGASAIPQRWVDCIPQRHRLEDLASKLIAAAP